MPSRPQDVGFTPELKLVLLCLRMNRDAATEQRIKELLGDALDWDEVAALVLSHQVQPYFYRSFQSIAPDGMPAMLRSDFERRFRDVAKRNLLLFAETLRMLSTFESEGILLIPYKGIVQSWLAYGDLGMRGCVDLDFACRQRDVARAVELVKDQRYESWLQPEELRLAERGQYPGQYGFERGNREFLIELHTERTLRYFPVQLEFDALERRLQTIEIGGRAIRTFSREDTLIFLCVHGAKHFWGRLNWICDVARLAAADPAPDWACLEARAAEMQCTRSVLLGLLLASELLGAQIPDALLARARREPNLLKLAQQVREFMAKKEESPRGIVRRAMFRLRTHDHFLSGLAHVWRLTTRPTERDWGYGAGATSRSSFLSGLQRPWRLIQRYGWRLAPEPERDLAIFEPTTDADVDRLIEFAGIGAEDVLYDLGCGDGRVVIRAAKSRGSRGVGVDIDPRRIAESRANANKCGVADRVRFMVQDAKKTDMSDATVVFIFLGAPGNLRILHNLRAQLRPGARVISRGYEIPGWEPEAREDPQAGNRSGRTLYRWRAGNSQANDALPAKQNAAHMNRVTPTKQHST